LPELEQLHDHGNKWCLQLLDNIKIQILITLIIIVIDNACDYSVKVILITIMN